MKIPEFLGYISLRSNLPLEALGELLSEKVFAGAKFGGKERAIHEEIPAIFIQNPFMGMLIVLDGYSGLGDDKWFTIHFQTWGDFGRYLRTNQIEENRVKLDWYLYYLFKEGLQNHPEIVIIEPQTDS
jgi:hypothetical protein